MNNLTIRRAALSDVDRIVELRLHAKAKSALKQVAHVPGQLAPISGLASLS
jgi:hypothetical protein